MLALILILHFRVFLLAFDRLVLRINQSADGCDEMQNMNKEISVFQCALEWLALTALHFIYCPFASESSLMQSTRPVRAHMKCDNKWQPKTDPEQSRARFATEVGHKRPITLSIGEAKSNRSRHFVKCKMIGQWCNRMRIWMHIELPLFRWSECAVKWIL